jgi:TonB family protein
MNSFLGLETIPAHVEIRPAAPGLKPPKLLIEQEPWARNFWRNLGDFLLRRRPAPVVLSCPPAAFWPDVFVTRRLPWLAFAESLLYHGIVAVLALSLSTLIATRPQVRQQARRFDPADVIYYSPSEYLPPLDTGSAKAAKPERGDPEYAKQPILSVPAESDNRRQTIVTPPNIKLSQEVATPNIVAWGNHTVPVPGAAVERPSPQMPLLPGQIVAPVPEVRESGNRQLGSISRAVVGPPPRDVDPGIRAVTSMSMDVVAPTPDANSAGTRRALRGPEAAIVEPPPSVNAASIRKLGDINIGHSDVVAPAPQLSVEAQRTLGSLASAGKAVIPPPPAMDNNSETGHGGTGRNARAQSGMGGAGGQIVPPPPSVEGSHSAEAGGRLIALGIHPAASPPAEPPVGNRRGTFAATPEGKTGATGTPDIRSSSPSATNGHGSGADAGKNGAGANANASIAGAPPGLHVGAASHVPANAVQGEGSGNGEAGNPRAAEGARQTEIASISKPKIGTGMASQPKAELVENPSPLERQIFHDRRLYSMTLNMPNLNSAGGSWVMRFAEVDGNQQKGELIAPVAEHKVDPAYPMQLMRENVAGTVTLRAIIRADGTVAEIRVVSGADARLDQYASQALARWHFRPAMKNDANVEVEAIVMIPFKPILKRSAF